MGKTQEYQENDQIIDKTQYYGRFGYNMGKTQEYGQFTGLYWIILVIWVISGKLHIWLGNYTY